MFERDAPDETEQIMGDFICHINQQSGLTHQESFLFVKIPYEPINLERKNTSSTFPFLFCAVWSGTTQAENNILIRRKDEIVLNTKQIIFTIFLRQSSKCHVTGSTS